MKKIMIIAALLMTTVTVMAQHDEDDVTIQPKIGMNVATLSDADKAIVNYHLGVEAEFMITDNFSASLGVVLSNQGAKYNKTDVMPEYDIDLGYVQVPIMASYYVLPGLAIKAGVQPGFKTKAKAKIDGQKVDMDQMYGLYNRVTDEDFKVNPIDLSIPVGISYEYKNIVLDARYNWGVRSVMNVGDSFYNRVFMVSLGYKFQLKD